MNKSAGNFSYPSSAAAVVFGVHLSARAAFRLDPASWLTQSASGYIENKVNKVEMAD